MEDVVRAWEEIAHAEERYRETVRAAIDDGVQQADIAKALGRTREMIRQDAMTPEQRAERRRRATERERERRRAKASTSQP